MAIKQRDTGVVRIKNVSGAPYIIEELSGHELADQEEINLCDPAIENYYRDWEAANRLVTELTTAQLHQDILAGKLTIIESRPPLL